MSKKLVAYITTAYPDRNFTVDLALALSESGVDSLELGIPFSDPLADGPIIEEANLRTLQNGFKLETLFDISKEIAFKIDTLWMGYFNTFYHKGIPFFVNQAVDSRVSGFIIPDLPNEESKLYLPIMEQSNLALISFVAPTSPKERIKELVENSKKFIYLVAYAGITGSGANEDLKDTIEHIREYSQTPIYVGFGVNEKTAKAKSSGVDGVIVGSAFVKILLDDSLGYSQKIKEISVMAKNIKDLINS